MSLKPYANYRTSDVPWVERVPCGWSTVPLFSVLRESKTPNSGLVEQNLLSLSYGRIIRKDISTSEGLLPESFETYQIVEPDYLVFRLTDLQNDKRSLRSARVRERGIITSAYASAQPVGIDPRYAEFLMRAYDTSKVFYSLGGGVRQSLRFSDVARLQVLLPTAAEQCAIVDYLDRETAEIDTLIEEQGHLMQALRERRFALVSHSVSSEAHPNWPVVPFVRCMLSQVDYRGATPRKTEEGVQLVTARNVKKGWIDYETSREFVDPQDYDEIMRRGLPELGDLLFTMEAPLGNVAVVDREDIALAQRVIKFQPDRKMASPHYLAYAVQGASFQSQLVARATGSTALGIKASKLPELRVALPDLEEQLRIAAYLDKQTAKIDTLIAETERFIDLARERRSALIAAAVTGQIDVRHEVA